MTDRIELDLTSHNNARYAVLTNALDDYAGKLEHEASNEEESDVYNGREAGSPQVVGLRESAAIARQLVEEIEQQLDN
jgi:hypothetical protein